MEKWSSFPIVPASGEVTNPAFDYARYLSREFSISLETSVLITCSAVTAAAGSTRLLRGPGKIVTPLAFNLLLVGEDLSEARLAVSDAFRTLVLLMRRAVWQTQALGASVIAGEQAKIVRKVREAKALKKAAQEDRAQWAGNFGVDFETRCSDFLAKNPPEYRKLEEQAGKILKEAAREHARLRMEQFPAFLVEGVDPEELMETDKLSADGTVFNLDLNGSTWSGLITDKPSRARKIARRLEAGWQGAPYLRDGRMQPASAVSLALMAPSDFLHLWQHRIIRDTRLRAVLLPAPVLVRNGPVQDEDELPAGVSAGFTRLLTSLLELRDWGTEEKVQMGPEARGIFFEFISDIREARRASGDLDRDIMDNMAPHTLRLALALHLGAGHSEKEKLNEETMRRACSLVAWSAAGSLQLLSTPQSDSPGPDGFDDEVIEMMIRVRRKGPLTKRELFRTYHDQRSCRHLPVLEKAIAQGMLEERGGVLVVAAGDN